jgi:hypothetical protein
MFYKNQILFSVTYLVKISLRTALAWIIENGCVFKTLVL